MKNNIVVVTAKPYELVLDDGKTITVQDEIYIGTINPESGAEYFYGAWFEKNEESFQFLGSISINQEDFEKRAGTVKDLEGKRIDLNEAF